ncbi:MobF family relaxase [Acidocella facilis]|uniref:MobF family relaxase n=1 Tax=Acidocella facilis TaxID=525 RepID=UPI001F257D42|nr:MobF family relaxase [Acidocella facilis]
MLTYRTGAAGAPAAARFMSEHLLQQTLSPEMAAMAEYYEQGVTTPTLADAAASRYGRFTAGGAPLSAETLDGLVRVEVERLAESGAGFAGRPDHERGELILRALAAFAAAGLVGREEAMACLARLSGADPASDGGGEGTGEEADDQERRLDAAMAEAAVAPDRSSATAAPRRDMNPMLARRLGIEPHRGLKPDEVACLLNGQRADGGVIAGRVQRASSLPLAQIFGLDAAQMPTSEQLARMLAGRKVNGEALPAGGAERAVRRLLAGLGVKDKTLTTEQRAHILKGRDADGREVSARQYQTILEAAKMRIGYIDLTFSAPKSLSIAWAFAPTKAERAMLHQAHRDAIDSVMAVIEHEIGRASIGDAAKRGYEAGSIGWVSFDHYAARPTVEVVREDEQGQSVTELHTLTGTQGRAPGDMQMHTHVTVFNIVETPSGRVGSINLALLEGRIHEWGALYQAYLANHLRALGVVVELDVRTEMAKLSAVPDSVVAQFSKRTIGGTEAARAYARSLGLDWERLSPARKIALLKAGVQNPREAKSDDVSDLAAWRATATRLGYQHRSVLRPDDIVPVPSREQRLETAFQAALPLLGKQFDRRAVIDGADARIAAAKGLIAAGIAEAGDVDAITQAFRERGVQRRGEDAALIWGRVPGRQGRDLVAVTTTLDVREEQTLIETARVGARDRSAALSRKAIAAAAASFPEIDFTSAHGRAQRRIIDQLGTGGRVGLAIGVAGSGKSTLLKPLVRAWQADGRVVHGVALAWRQSDDLAEAGIPTANTRAVTAFLRDVERGKLVLGRKSVVVVDEVGLLGTRQLNATMAAQAEKGFQLVMIGDPKQMQAVEAGPVIELLRRALGAGKVPELGSSVRQKAEEERETVLMFRNGQTEEAVRRKDANGTLQVVSGGYEEAVAHVAVLWRERREANRDRQDFSISVSAPSNAEAHDISLAIRQQRRSMGEIGPDQITVRATDGAGEREYELALAVGDQVRLFRRTNAKFMEAGTVGNIGRNGSVLEIIAVDAAGLTLRNAAGRDGVVAWDTLQGEASGSIQLAYGDALTTNTAQGTTVTEHIHAMPGGTKLVSAFGAYTSGSRHREQSFIVTSEGAERAEVIARRPLGDRREIERGDLLNNIIRNFAQQPEKEAALALIDRAVGLRRGSVQAMQRVHQAAEASGGGLEQASMLRERMLSRRVAQALEEMLPGLAAQLRRHGGTLARVARIGADVAELLARVARRTLVNRHAEAEFWHLVGERGQDLPDDRVEQRKQTRGHGR